LSTPFRLLLPTQFVDEIFAHARAEVPNECCGLLAGRIEAGVALAVQRYPLPNAAASPVEYLSEPKAMFAAMRDMRSLGIDVIAVYHSHPTSDPIPSKADRERNYSTEVVNLIISLKSNPPTMRGWWLTAESATEAMWQECGTINPSP
jgi:[CysO sulfur-carrier protein]-S-L-cysteine hydrolase